jgi:hypothetical protein
MKLLADMLNTPSIWFGKGDELLVFLRKPTAQRAKRKAQK